VPKAAARAAAKGADITYSPVYQIDARYAQPGLEQKLMATLRDYDRRLPQRLNEIQQRLG
jgi:hypothetical protein